MDHSKNYGTRDIAEWTYGTHACAKALKFTLCELKPYMGAVLLGPAPVSRQ